MESCAVKTCRGVPVTRKLVHPDWLDDATEPTEVDVCPAHAEPDFTDVGLPRRRRWFSRR